MRASTNVSVIFEVTPSAEAKVSAQQGRLSGAVRGRRPRAGAAADPCANPFSSASPSPSRPARVAHRHRTAICAVRTSSSQADAGSTPLGRRSVAGDDDHGGAGDRHSAPRHAAVAQRDTVDGLRTLVIDPGHGGEELGAQGPRGTLEKDVTLAVARRLRTLVESRLGLKVFLTREDDRTLALDDRSAFANAHKADVFLSIHANAAVRAVAERRRGLLSSPLSEPMPRRESGRTIQPRRCRSLAAARA